VKRKTLLLLLVAVALTVGAGIWAAQLLIAPPEDRTSPSSADGRIVYDEACARCHGPVGNGKGGNPRLRGRDLARDLIRIRVQSGYRAMPRFPNIRGEALKNLAAHVAAMK
jgi:cytochrome c553